MLKNRQKVKIKKFTGQVLIELLIIIALFSILATGLTMVVSVSTKSKQIASLISQARSLIQEYREAIVSISLNSWNVFDSLAKGTTNYYHLVKNVNWEVQPGKENFIFLEKNVERYFTLENVYRDINNIPTTSVTSIFDPSLIKINIFVKINQTEFKDELFLSRWVNLAIFQGAWGGGPGESGPVRDFTNKFASSSNIDFYETEIKLSK